MSDDIDDAELLAVARRAAHAAGAELRSRFGHSQPGIRAKSSPTDLVSDADVAAEQAIRDILGELARGDAILGEEGGETGGDGERRWVIDPLDGTTNFLFGVPQFAVSVACEDRRGTVVGAVLDPIRDECFTATRSRAPELNGVRIVGSDRQELSTALVATGFAYEAEVRARQAAVLGRILPRVRDIRRAGSAALDLAWCACGRYDAYYERGLKPWDFAAGALIATRSGLTVRTLPPGDGPEGLLAAPPAFVDGLQELVLGV
ncbi:MAG TPA: inositol monophosphatase family protein [Solirubrobacteraceae bacterium]|jgi:myo-inositol-1(or 4)-monophosphatase